MATVTKWKYVSINKGLQITTTIVLPWFNVVPIDYGFFLHKKQYSEIAQLCANVLVAI